MHDHLNIDEAYISEHLCEFACSSPKSQGKNTVVRSNNLNIGKSKMSRTQLAYS